MSEINNLTNKAKNTAEDAKDFANNLKDKAAEAGEYLQDKAVSIGKEAWDKALDTQEYFVHLVRENPYKSLGIAFLGGWLLSLCRSKLNSK